MSLGMSRQASRRSRASLRALATQPGTILPVTPSLDAVRRFGDQAIEVLDRMGREQRAVQRPGDARPLQVQRFAKAFARD